MLPSAADLDGKLLAAIHQDGSDPLPELRVAGLLVVTM
jgi:hypothetical protein